MDTDADDAAEQPTSKPKRTVEDALECASDACDVCDIADLASSCDVPCDIPDCDLPCDLDPGCF